MKNIVYVLSATLNVAACGSNEAPVAPNVQQTGGNANSTTATAGGTVQMAAPNGGSSGAPVNSGGHSSVSIGAGGASSIVSSTGGTTTTPITCSLGTAIATTESFTNELSMGMCYQFSTAMPQTVCAVTTYNTDGTVATTTGNGACPTNNILTTCQNSNYFNTTGVQGTMFLAIYNTTVGAAAAANCGSWIGLTGNGTGGASSIGGATSTGGATNTGGNKTTGGVPTTGGVSAAGGTTTSGGTYSTGGRKATGGAPPATGGAPRATGGAAPATGGITASGGTSGNGVAASSLPSCANSGVAGNSLPQGSSCLAYGAGAQCHFDLVQVIVASALITPYTCTCTGAPVPTWECQ